MCGVCLHVEAMCAHMHMCGSTRKTLGTLLYHSLLHFFETESRTEAGAVFPAKTAASKLRQPSCPSP